MSDSVHTTPRHPHKAKRGQLRIKGYLCPQTGQPHYHFAAGEGVPGALLPLLKAFFASPRYDIRHVYGLEADEATSLLDELHDRGYAMGTFEFSLYMKDSGARVAQRIHQLKTSPGRLIARWSRLPYDSPDICTAWMRPSHRGDSALLCGFLSDNLYLDWKPGMPRQPMTMAKAFRTTMEKLGADLRTLRIQVDHTARAAALAQQAKEKALG